MKIDHCGVEGHAYEPEMRASAFMVGRHTATDAYGLKAVSEPVSSPASGQKIGGDIWTEREQ